MVYVKLAVGGDLLCKHAAHNKRLTDFVYFISLGLYIVKVKCFNFVEAVYSERFYRVDKVANLFFGIYRSALYFRKHAFGKQRRGIAVLVLGFEQYTVKLLAEYAAEYDGRIYQIEVGLV